MWSPWKGRHGFHGKNFPEHVLGHMDERVETLNLTTDQKERYQALREGVKSELASGRDARLRLMTSLRREMGKELPDLHQVTSLLSEHAGRMPQALDRGMSRFLEFYEILDDAQKAKVIGHFKDRLKKTVLPPERAGESLRGNATPGPAGEVDSGSISLPQEIATQRGDRHGELM